MYDIDMFNSVTLSSKTYLNNHKLTTSKSAFTGKKEGYVGYLLV